MPGATLTVFDKAQTMDTLTVSCYYVLKNLSKLL